MTAAVPSSAKSVSAADATQTSKPGVLTVETGAATARDKGMDSSKLVPLFVIVPLAVITGVMMLICELYTPSLFSGFSSRVCYVLLLWVFRSVLDQGVRVRDALCHLMHEVFLPILLHLVLSLPTHPNHSILFPLTSFWNQKANPSSKNTGAYKRRMNND